MRQGDERLAALLAALAPDDAPDAAVPEDVLRAFAEHASAGGSRRSGARILRISRAAALKAAVAVLALSSGTVAAAAADVLPGPAQRAAHNLFGGWGVPAPQKKHSTTPSSPAASPGASVSPAASAAPPGASHAASVSPSISASCSGSNTHAASEHCAGHPTQAAGHGHTPSPHSSAAR